uniref:Sorbin and SH3 domain containing 1 n=1 Tax=Petromyzon marinus TaxID=7757 RepID=S4RB59_PETMA
SDSQRSFSPTGRASAYPSTMAVNPTIVLLQHNRLMGGPEQQKRLSRLSAPDAAGQTGERAGEHPHDRRAYEGYVDGQRWAADGRPSVRVIRPPDFPGIGAVDEAGIPLTSTDRPKDWYKTMFNQIHKVNKEPSDCNPYLPTYRFPESTRMPLDHVVPRSKSLSDSRDFDAQQQRSATLPARICLRSAAQRTHPSDSEWEPPDKRVDTRSYRAEPKSIFEYEPGRSSVLDKEAPMSAYSVSAEQPTDKSGYSMEPGYYAVRRQSEPAVSPVGAPGCEEEERQVYKAVLEGGDIPMQGLSSVIKRPSITSAPLSPRSKAPGDIRESAEVVARRRREEKERMLEEQRRIRREQEEADIASRRHSGVFLSHHQFITNDRFGDLLNIDDSWKRTSVGEPTRQTARAKYNFRAQSQKELPLHKGDVVYINRQVDQNWYEGEHHGRVGIFPATYVELQPTQEKAPLSPLAAAPPQVIQCGEAVGKFNFTADSHLEMSFKKRKAIMLLIVVMINWATTSTAGTTRIQGWFDRKCLKRSRHPLHQGTDPYSPIPSSSLSLSPPRSLISYPEQPQPQQPVRIPDDFHLTGEPFERFQAIYNYKPQNEDELELLVGDVVEVMEKCDDGWFVGTSRRTRLFGTFPGNYVKRVYL